MGYTSLLNHLKCQSIKARFTQTDMRSLQSVMLGRLDCQRLVSMFSLAVPSRHTRLTGVFHVPGGRVNSVRNGFLSRIPAAFNVLKTSPRD